MSRTVLVIDDDCLVLDTAEMLLRDLGFRVWRATNGAEGLACFLAAPPDLVLADLIMPEREGIETIQAMRRLRPDARIVAMSGGGAIGREWVLDMATKLGADRALAKPFDSADLSAVIRQAMADAR